MYAMSDKERLARDADAAVRWAEADLARARAVAAQAWADLDALYAVDAEIVYTAGTVA